jgi:hypothetical protein
VTRRTRPRRGTHCSILQWVGWVLGLRLMQVYGNAHCYLIAMGHAVLEEDEGEEPRRPRGSAGTAGIRGCSELSARGSRAISRILCSIAPRGTIGGSHFSGTRIAPGLKRPTRGPRPGRPLRSSTGGPLLTPSYLALLQVTLAGQPCRHDRGGLLPRHFTLA